MFGRRFRFATVVAVAGATALLGACHPSLPIPRIEPVLANWTQPYTGNDKLRVHVFDTGTLTLPQAAAWAGGYWMSSERFDMLAFVIEHPEHGLVVFDTGLSPKIVDDSEAYMGKLLSWMSRPEMSEGMDLPSQMRAVGLDPAAVDTVVLSHLHFDHTGSLEEFPNATVVVAGAELAEARSDSWRNTYVLPGDFDGVTSWREIDFEDAEPVATFVAGIDLFGDGSMHVVDLATRPVRWGCCCTRLRRRCCSPGMRPGWSRAGAMPPDPSTHGTCGCGGSRSGASRRWPSWCPTSSSFPDMTPTYSPR